MTVILLGQVHQPATPIVAAALVKVMLLEDNVTGVFKEHST